MKEILLPGYIAVPTLDSTPATLWGETIRTTVVRDRHAVRVQEAGWELVVSFNPEQVDRPWRVSARVIDAATSRQKLGEMLAALGCPGTGLESLPVSAEPDAGGWWHYAWTPN